MGDLAHETKLNQAALSDTGNLVRRGVACELWIVVCRITVRGGLCF